MKNAVIVFNTMVITGVIGWSIGSGKMDAPSLLLAGAAWLSIVISLLED